MSSARDAVFGDDAPAASTTTGVDHATAVLTANAEAHPQAPGLPNAVSHIGGADPNPQGAGGDANSPAAGAHGDGHQGVTSHGGVASHGDSNSEHHTHGHSSSGIHAGGGGAGTHATGAVGKGAGRSSDNGHMS